METNTRDAQIKSGVLVHLVDHFCYDDDDNDDGDGDQHMLREERRRGGEGEEARGRDDHCQHLVKDLLALQRSVTYERLVRGLLCVLRGLSREAITLRGL